MLIVAWVTGYANGFLHIQSRQTLGDGTRSRAIALVMIVISVLAFASELWAIITDDAGAISSFAHVGGFAAGLLLALLPRSSQTRCLLPREAGRVEYNYRGVAFWYLLDEDLSEADFTLAI